MTFNAVSDTFYQHDVFVDGSPESLSRLVPFVKIANFSPGTLLLQHGSPANDFMVILQGTFQQLEKEPQHPTRFHKYLGEEAAIGLNVYIAGALATTAITVMIIPHKEMKLFIDANPNIINKLLLSFSQRFDTTPVPVPISVSATDGFPSSQKTNLRPLIGWLATLIVPLGLFFGLQQSGELTDLPALYFVSITGIVVIMWIFRLIPDFAAALFAIMGVILLGLAPPTVALSGFSSNSFFLAMGIFGLSVVISLSGLSFRILLWLLRLGPAHKSWYNISLFLVGLLLTPVIPTTNGRVAIVGTFFDNLTNIFGKNINSTEQARLSASVMGGSVCCRRFF